MLSGAIMGRDASEMARSWSPLGGAGHLWPLLTSYDLGVDEQVAAIGPDLLLFELVSVGRGFQTARQQRVAEIGVGLVGGGELDVGSEQVRCRGLTQFTWRLRATEVLANGAL